MTNLSNLEIIKKGKYWWILTKKLLDYQIPVALVVFFLHRPVKLPIHASSAKFKVFISCHCGVINTKYNRDSKMINQSQCKRHSFWIHALSHARLCTQSSVQIYNNKNVEFKARYESNTTILTKLIDISVFKSTKKEQGDFSKTLLFRSAGESWTPSNAAHADA